MNPTRSLWRHGAAVVLGLVLALLCATQALADTSYVVQKGDNLSRIATRFNVTVDAIVRANHLKDPNAIQVGQTLIIPDGQPSAAPAAGGAATSYTVRSGDSVARIARKFNISMEELIRANNLTSTVLQIGQVLVIPGAAPAASAPVDSVYNRVTGTDAFVAKVRAGLDWLQANDPDAYNRANTYITIIRVSPYNDRAQAAPLRGGGCYVRGLAYADMPDRMVAVMLFHEATHCMQFATVGDIAVKAAEVDAYTQQIAFMERHGFPGDEIAFYREVLAYYQSLPDDATNVPPPDF